MTLTTTQAIIITQIPIAIAILILAFEAWLTKKELMKLLEKLVQNNNAKNNSKSNSKSKKKR